MRPTFFFFVKSAMAIKIFFFVWFALAFAEGNNGVYSDFDVLKNLTDSGSGNILEASDKVKNILNLFDEFIKERLDPLIWECTVQQQNLNKSIIEATTKGMLKNKQFTNFQCISNAALDTFKKLDKIKIQTLVDSRNIYEKGQEAISSFRMSFAGFYGYIQDLHKSKKEELEKAENEGARKRILEELKIKLKLLDSVLQQITRNAETSKFKFMEEYIKFALTTEKNLKLTHKEGADSMMKCVS